MIAVQNRWRPALVPPTYSRSFLAQTPMTPLKEAIRVPPFDLPMVTSGIILTVGGLVGGAVGTYMAIRGAEVIGKKIPTFWQWYFGTGGVGATLAILGAIPLVALGILQIAGGVIIEKKLEEIGQSMLKPPPGG